MHSDLNSPNRSHPHICHLHQALEISNQVKNRVGIILAKGFFHLLLFAVSSQVSTYKATETLPLQRGLYLSSLRSQDTHPLWGVPPVHEAVPQPVRATPLPCFPTKPCVSLSRAWISQTGRGAVLRNQSHSRNRLKGMTILFLEPKREPVKVRHTIDLGGGAVTIGGLTLGRKGRWHNSSCGLTENQRRGHSVAKGRESVGRRTSMRSIASHQQYGLPCASFHKRWGFRALPFPVLRHTAGRSACTVETVTRRTPSHRVAPSRHAQGTIPHSFDFTVF